MDCRLFWLFFNGILAYELLCPAELHRKLRAEIVCDGNSTEQYSCFLDQFSKTYKESCKDTSDFVRPGKKYVIGVFRKNTDCDLWRFQPFKFWSHQLSQCVFSKSRCKDNGQIMHSLGSTFGDSVCRCDHRKGYAFLKNTTDPCFCKPSEEDCTCYIKICPPNYRLTPDYECKLSLSEISNCPDVQPISDTTKTTNKPFDVKDMKFNTTTIGSYRSTILYTILIILVAVLSILIFVVYMKRKKEKLKLREDNGLQITQITTVDQSIDHQRRALTSSDDIPHDEKALNAGELMPELILEVNTNYRCKTEFSKERNGAVNDICLQSTQTTTVDQSFDHQRRTLTSFDDISQDEEALYVGECKPELLQERKTNHQRKTEWFEKKEKETGEMSQSEAINSKKSFVVAIECGTTYSGYAFSEKSSPNTISTCSWQKSTLVSMKAPTAVLLDKEKNFVAFGFDAETKYLESLEIDDSDDEDDVPKDVYHYFHRFTMMLHKKSFNFDTTIKDQNGIQMKAFDIYSFSIKYMKDQVIRRLVNSVETTDIHYVLIVPDLWDDVAKETIRKAAEKAGIKDKNFKIVLGPESALIYCQTYRDQDNDKPYSRLMNGSKYVVVDLGGSTAGISVHERQFDYSFKEVMLPGRVEWGGTSVDKSFLDFVYSVFTRKVIKELHSDEQEDYTMLFHEFEVKKRTITSEYSNDIVIALPVSLLEITKKHCTSVPAAIQMSRYKECVSFKGQNIYIKPAAFRQLFKPTINAIIKHLDKLLQNPNLSDLNHIIMVGGFSECELIQTAMRQKFPRKKIIIPDKTGLAVLRGAVLLGHQLVSL